MHIPYKFGRQTQSKMVKHSLTAPNTATCDQWMRVTAYGIGNRHHIRSCHHLLKATTLIRLHHAPESFSLGTTRCATPQSIFISTKNPAAVTGKRTVGCSSSFKTTGPATEKEMPIEGLGNTFRSWGIDLGKMRTWCFSNFSLKL